MGWRPAATSPTTDAPLDCWKGLGVGETRSTSAHESVPLWTPAIDERDPANLLSVRWSAQPRCALVSAAAGAGAGSRTPPPPGFPSRALTFLLQVLPLEPLARPLLQLLQLRGAARPAAPAQNHVGAGGLGGAIEAVAAGGGPSAPAGPLLFLGAAVELGEQPAHQGRRAARPTAARLGGLRVLLAFPGIPGGRGRPPQGRSPGHFRNRFLRDVLRPRLRLCAQDPASGCGKDLHGPERRGPAATAPAPPARPPVPGGGAASPRGVPSARRGARGLGIPPPRGLTSRRRRQSHRPWAPSGAQSGAATPRDYLGTPATGEARFRGRRGKGALAAATFTFKHVINSKRAIPAASSATGWK